MKQWDVVTFGETMLRLSAPGFSRLEEADTLDVRIGGAESNTAVAMARLGMRVAWWSKLPNNPLGRRIEGEVRRWGVDTSYTLWDDSPSARAGLYFLDFGLPPRSIDVYYDRASASASKITAIEVDSFPFTNAKLLYLTGITPALSPYCSKAVQRALAIAKEAGMQVAFDVNYRAKLWKPEEARRELEPLFASVNLLFCTQGDANNVLGVHGDGKTIVEELHERYEVEAVVVTTGETGASAFCRGQYLHKPALNAPNIIDRVGRGDAFNAGVIMGFLEENLQRGLEYGVVMAALKQTMPGDLLLSNRAEIEAAMNTGSVGIRR